ncbi:MAG: HNH endonuclease [Candidatus Lutacidiplasmatales archaeon]
MGCVFERTDGCCAYCGKPLAWRNYGSPGTRGAWEVDHQVPISRGGTNSLRNLSAACIPCNRSKSDRHATSYRRGFEPTTTAGKIIDYSGLPPGTLGASRERVRRY